MKSRAPKVSSPSSSLVRASTKRKPPYLCKECGQEEVAPRLDGLHECRVCGRIFDGPPTDIPVKLGGEWKKRSFKK